jgi:hypothetical protein
MDINEAHYKMGHMGEVALRKCKIITTLKQQGNLKTVLAA